MILETGSCRLRPYRRADIDALPPIANDIEVARYMSRRFPHPYTRADAEHWVALVSERKELSTFAIEVDGELAGGIGFVPQHHEHSGIAEVGYWLGRRYWSRGIATEALHAIVDYAFGTYRLRRLQANVMAPNTSSARVLEHAGFTREGLLRQIYVDREGAVHDGLLYARLLPERA